MSTGAQVVLQIVALTVLIKWLGQRDGVITDAVLLLVTAMWIAVRRAGRERRERQALLAQLAADMRAVASRDPDGG
jgi:hypothetical protein